MAVEDADATHVFQLVVEDDEGAFGISEVTVTVTAPNVSPIANAGADQTVASGAAVQLDGSASSDRGGTIATYEWSWTSGTGEAVRLTGADSVRPGFMADRLAPGAADVTHVFTLIVTDDEGAFDFDTVTVTVGAAASNTAPTANAGADQTATPGATVRLDGSGSMDNEGSIASYSWTRTGGTTGRRVTLSGAKTAQPSFTADTLFSGAADVTHVFSLVVTDEEGVNSIADEVTVTVIAPNAVPVANAGPDQTVRSGATVQLDGSASTSDRRRTIASHAWSRTDGTSDDTVALSDANVSRPSFTADILTPGAADVTHVFSLVVTDNEDAESFADTVTVTVVSNTVPVANAGPDQTVAPGAAVQLMGSGTDDDGTVGAYSWRRTGGTGDAAVVLSGENTAQLSFTADTLASGVDDATHIFTLVVTDNEEAESVADTVTVTVTAGNVPPVADAGSDREVQSGETVRLNGSGSDDSDGSIASWAWTRTGGTGDDTVVLSGEDTARLSFTADTLPPGDPDVTHVFSLVVTDNADAESVADTVTVTVRSMNLSPVAAVGPDRTVQSGETVTLDASRSYDRDGTIVRFQWLGNVVGPGNIKLPLENADTATPGFMAPALAPGDEDLRILFQLIIWDNEGDSDLGSMTVTVTAPNVPPVADAGLDQSVASGATVLLDASGSEDSDGSIVSYQWRRTGGSGNRDVVLSGADTAELSFTADTLAVEDADVTHVFQLVVEDDEGAFGISEVTVTVTAPNVSPIANAGADQTVASGAAVQLDGSASSDRGGTIATYEWSWTSGTGEAVRLTGADSVRPGFMADRLAPGAADVTHVFTLIVTDDEGAFDFDTVTVTATAPLVAEAGPAKNVASEETVTLDGSGTVSDSARTVTYAWTRTVGTSGTLVDADKATARFTAPALNPGDADAIHTFTLTVTDDQSSTAATDTVTITVTASPFDALVAHAGPDLPEPGEPAIISGTLVTLDGSGSTAIGTAGGRTVTYAWTRATGADSGNGSAVTLAGADTATPSFTPPTLTPGAPAVTYGFTLTVTDDQSSTPATSMVTITVISGFVAPVAIIADGVREVASGGTVDLDGGGSTFDSRRTPLTYAWTRADGTSTGLTDPATATPVFTPPTLADGDPDATHILTLTVTDSANVSDSAMVTITVTSGFVAPVAIIADGVREVATGGTVDLDGGGSTFDSRRTPLTYAWTRADGTSTGLTDPATATPVFTPPTLADGADDVTHILTLTVTDSANVSDSAMVTITVTSGFVAPVAVIADGVREVATGGTVDLDGGGSTFDSRRTPLTHAWTRADGTTTGLTDPATATPVFTPPTLADGADDATHVLTLTVTDSANVSDSAMVTITVTSGFVAPVAIIADGVREVATGGTVDLDGGGSTFDSRRTPLTYAWTRADGTSTGLTDPATATPVFTPPTLADGADDATHILTLTVTDSANVSDSAMVTITVTSGFVAPVAVIADGVREVATGGTVDLDGGGSTFDSRRSPLTYAWTRADGTSTGLTDPATATPVFTPPTLADGADDVTHILTLTVTDSANVSDSAMVTITVTSGFVAPVAIIADGVREVATGGTVDLDGGGSTFDSRRSPLTYAWTRADGTTTGLADPATATPVFTPPVLADGDPDASHVLTLTVTDSANVSDSAMVEITVTSGFVAPVAVIADGVREVASGGTVDLDGGGSTFDSRRAPLTYAWTRADGTTTGLTDPATATPVFTPPTLADGDPDASHVLTLTVTDSANVSDSAMVEITVTSGFVAPVAIIADGVREVATGGTVDLDGGGSTFDSRRSPLTYAWTRADGTTTGLTDPATATPVFTPPTLADGADDATHILTLTVTDSANVSDSAMVTITVTAPANRAPVARIMNAGEGPIRVAPGALVRLDGRGSTDRNGGPVASYLWEQTGGPSVELMGAMTAQASFVAGTTGTAQAGFVANTLAAGAVDVTYEFTLTVTDNDGAANTSAPVTVIVSAAAQVEVDIRVSPSELTVQEGGSGTYKVRLSQSPGREVIVRATPDDEDKVVLKKAHLVFDAKNWNKWQDVKISTLADSDNKNDEVRIRHRLSDAQGEALGEPGGVVRVTLREDDPILRPVGEFVAARATALLNIQPDLTGFLKQDGITQGGGGRGSGDFSFRATDGRLTMNGGFVRDGVWGKVTGSYASSDSGDAKSVLGSFGIHRKYSRNFLAGAMLQFDLSDHDLAGQAGTTDTIDGTGWLAGPYFAARHDTQPLYFEGRLLYGQSDNDIRFNDSGTGIGTRTGSFDSKRLLAQLRVEGEIALSTEEVGPRLIPYADARWIEDRAAAFTTDSIGNSIGIRVPGQKVSVGQFELGSNVEVPIAITHGAMTFTGGLGLVWSNTEGDHVSSVSRSRGRGEMGLSYGLDDNLRIDFESFYDGIGSSGHEGYGLSLSAEMKF